MLSGLDTDHDLGDGHRLLGRRTPDLDPITADGERGLLALLHDARTLPDARATRFARPTPARREREDPG